MLIEWIVIIIIIILITVTPNKSASLSFNSKIVRIYNIILKL